MNLRLMDKVFEIKENLRAKNEENGHILLGEFRYSLGQNQFYHYNLGQV